MSSMGRKTIYSIALMAGTALAFPATAQAQEAGRSSLVAQQPGQMDQAVGQWEYLTARADLPFASYAGEQLTKKNNGTPLSVALNSYLLSYKNANSVTNMTKGLPHPKC